MSRWRVSLKGSVICHRVKAPGGDESAALSQSLLRGQSAYAFCAVATCSSISDLDCKRSDGRCHISLRGKACLKNPAGAKRCERLNLLTPYTCICSQMVFSV